MRAKFLQHAAILILSISLSSFSAAQNFQPFVAGTLDEIKAAYAGKPFLLNLWSTDCLPCRLELEMLGKLKAEQPDFPLVLISTDLIDYQEESFYILEDYGLENIQTWIFADTFTERLRYSIDPTWYGELPRSYLYNADHSFAAHSGVLTQELLDSFVAAVQGAE